MDLNGKYYVHVFGKKSCAKCAMLNKRLDELLAKSPYQDRFVKVYNDLETEDGLINFCLAKCLNPNRVPGMVVASIREDGSYEYLANPDPNEEDPICRHSRLFSYLGIQTDYSAEGKGLITPQMIQSILDKAMEL